ncbi:MAG: aminopeptidase [Bacilli bacterium]|nr:aminopeptidase [Bacilli bacterium]
MEELMRKYAEVLLKTCLKIEKDQPLLITYNIERSDFVRIVTEEAYKLGVKDIYYDMSDPYIRKEALKNLEVEELKKLTFWNKEIWNVYAKKNAAFLMLASETPGLMKDVDPKKISEMTKYALSTRKEFDDLRDKSMISWTIAAVPTKRWADELFKEENSVEILWNKIFDICSIKEDDPVSIWNDKIDKLNRRAEKLNSYRFKTLIYKSSNGTDFKIKLPEKHLWASGREVLQNKKEVLVNFPTEEVFTSPDCRSAEGIVYSSKPLSYQGVIINNFNISFKEGKVIDCHAKEGEDTLKELINICENSDMLGEVALVPNDSPISNSNQVFLETLYDENAACHLALGDSFTECIENGPNMKKEDLFNNYNLNKCDSHTDFMIGTSDLNITGITQDNKEVPIFINGNFTKDFE